MSHALLTVAGVFAGGPALLTRHELHHLRLLIEHHRTRRFAYCAACDAYAPLSHQHEKETVK